MRGRSAAELLALPVRLHGIELGRPTEILVDRTVDRMLGFEVMCGDGAPRFVPLPVVELRHDEIALASALTMIDEGDLEFYRRRSRRLAELGYAEPWVGPDGAIVETRSAA